MIDTHCHLIDPQFKKDLDAVLTRAQKAGVINIINVGYDVETSIEAARMGEKSPWLLAGIGIHPNEAAHELIKEMGRIEEILGKNRIYAIGETGLDYYRDFSPRSAQRELFRKHIILAKTHDLPLLIHTRRSVDDAIKILEQEEFHRGVFHCYTGTYEEALRIVELGFYLGFGGILTFSKGIQDVFCRLPLDRILLETDAPFLAPTGHRWQRNEPAYILEILKAAARLLNLPEPDLEAIVDNNARALLAL
jgi:TatD DNase family protein